MWFCARKSLRSFSSLCDFGHVIAHRKCQNVHKMVLPGQEQGEVVKWGDGGGQRGQRGGRVQQSNFSQTDFQQNGTFEQQCKRVVREGGCTVQIQCS